MERRHLRRLLFCTDDALDDGLVSFASNDYLGLAEHPALRESAKQAIDRYGLGSGASRLITGTRRPHLALEEALADFKGTEAALTFSSGYAASMGVGTALLDRKSVVLLDKLTHASLIDAVRLSGATVRVFAHNDLSKLESLLRWARTKHDAETPVMVITESVFSMDGDRCPLAAIVALKERYGASLLVDEAHAIGVLGPSGAGLAAALGLTSGIDIHLGTMSKALGVSGGYLAGSRALIDLLINRARSFVYSTAPPAAVAAAATTALSILRGAEGDALRALLWERIEHLAMGLGVQAESAILPHVLGSAEKALECSAALRARGFIAPAIRYPTVPRNAARLRFTLSARHTEDEVATLIAALRSSNA